MTDSDALLLELDTPSISAGSSQTVSESVTIPSSLSGGSYYIWVTADVLNEVGQSNVNNDAATVPFSISGSESNTCTDPNQLVTIPDNGLERALRDELAKPSGAITCSDMAGLTNFEARGYGIVSLEGLQYAENLTDLGLRDNQISDLTPLAGLTNLTTLYLAYNQISDLTGLAGLTNLTILELRDNQISNISALVNNLSLGDGDSVALFDNCLDLSSFSADRANIEILFDRGVDVLVELQYTPQDCSP